MQMSAEHAIDIPMLPLSEQMNIKIRKLRRKCIGIQVGVLMTLSIGPGNPIVNREAIMRYYALENIGTGYPGQFESRLSDTRRLGLGQMNTDQIPIRLAMSAQHREGIMMASLHEFLQGVSVSFGSGTALDSMTILVRVHFIRPLRVK
jgi:hypothetical protein